MTIPMRSDYHSLHLLELVEQRQVLEERLVLQSNLNIRDNEGRNALYWAIQSVIKKRYLISKRHSYLPTGKLKSLTNIS